MKQYQYTLHTKQKLKLPVYLDLGITKKKIQRIIEHPEAIDKSEDPVYIAIASLTEKLSLCVAYRKIQVSGIIRIITFYPAEKGRYERKIL